MFKLTKQHTNHISPGDFVSPLSPEPETPSKTIIIKEDAAEFLDNIPFGHSAEERQLARNWINTAAQQLRNAEYYRAERDKLGRLLIKIVEEVEADVINDCPICCGGWNDPGVELTKDELHTLDCQLYLEVQDLTKLLSND